MKYGICLIKTRPEKWLTTAQRAEELGYESIWLPEHLVFPIDMDSSYPDATTPAGDRGTVPKPPPTMPVWDAPSALNYIAAATTRIRLGTFVYLLGLRHPFVAARAFQTLDYFSGGRAEVGVGVGWLKSEWRATGLDPSTRGRRLDEVLEVCKRLWTEDVIEHHGEFFDFEPVAFEPKPVQRPWPPIQIGGESDAAFRRIAQHGNGWLAHEHTHESFKEPYGRFREVLEAQGRSLDSVDITIARQPSTPDDVARWEEEFGVKRIILFPGSRATGGDALRAMEEFAEGFMAQ